MSRFDRYMLSQLMMLFGFFSLILVAVYWINRAVALFDQLIADGQSAWVFLEFTALTLPNVIRLVLPVSAFAATVYVTNRLSNESELVVMQATGFSPFRLARPVLIFGLVVALLMSALLHFLVPSSRFQLAERRTEIAENITSRLLNEGQFLHPAPGITLYIREVTPQGELRDIFLSDNRSEGSRTTYTAERALLVRGDDGPKLLMFEGMSQMLRTDTKRLFVTRFSDFAYDIGALIAPGDREGLDLREFSTPRLIVARAGDIASTGATPAEFLAQAHDRIAGTLQGGAFALVGFAVLLLGGFSRFGIWPQILAAVLVLIVLQLISNAVTEITESDTRMWPLAYAPIAVGGGVAALLLWWAGRPRRRRRGTEVAA